MSFDFSKVNFNKIPDETFAKFENIGDSLTGVLINVRHDIDKGMDGLKCDPVLKFVFRTPAGDHKCFAKSPESYIVKNKLVMAKLGDLVQITFTDKAPVANKPGFKRKVFDVAIADQNDAEWLAKNQDKLTSLDCRLAVSQNVTSEPEIRHEDEIRSEDLSF